jgi:hypothetical protein
MSKKRKDGHGPTVALKIALKGTTRMNYCIMLKKEDKQKRM